MPQRIVSEPTVAPSVTLSETQHRKLSDLAEKVVNGTIRLEQALASLPVSK